VEVGLLQGVSAYEVVCVVCGVLDLVPGVPLLQLVERLVDVGAALACWRALCAGCVVEGLSCWAVGRACCGACHGVCSLWARQALCFCEVEVLRAHAAVDELCLPEVACGGLYEVEGLVGCGEGCWVGEP